MNVYTIGLITGGVGLIAMAVGGMAAHGHASAGDHGPIHGGGDHAGHGHAGHGHAAPVHHGGGHGDPAHSASSANAIGSGWHSYLPGWVWSLLTPRGLFSALTGFGAVGLAVSGLVEPIRLASALAGGFAFEIALAGPLSRLLMRFASTPALTLESCLMDEVKAAAGFDAEGQGLVSAELDGQIVQVLATLRPEDRARGVRVRIGDRLRVEEVDARQRFIVSVL